MALKLPEKIALAVQIRKVLPRPIINGYPEHNDLQRPGDEKGRVSSLGNESVMGKNFVRDSRRIAWLYYHARASAAEKVFQNFVWAMSLQSILRPTLSY